MTRYSQSMTLTPTEAHVISHTEMLLLKVGLPDWRVELNESKRIAGRTMFESKTIYLSRPCIRATTLEEALDTSSHEVAHAQVGPRHGHDSVWRMAHRALGGSGRRTTDNSKYDDAKMGYLWFGMCPNNHSFGLSRRPQVLRSCNICYPGKFNPEYAILYVNQKTGEEYPTPF